MIGGGDESMRLSRATFAMLESADEVSDIKQTVAHESAHGQQVDVHGTLEIDGEEIDPLLLYEGHAEIHGNEAVGMGKAEHREGQPADVYREGQNVVLDIIQSTSREAVERALTGDGDLNRLQQEIDAKKQREPSYALAA